MVYESIRNLDTSKAAGIKTIDALNLAVSLLLSIFHLFTTFMKRFNWWQNL